MGALGGLGGLGGLGAIISGLLARATFTADDNTLLASYTPELGGAFTAQSNDGEIQGNLVEATSSAVCISTLELNKADVSIEADITIRSTAANSQIGFTGRFDATNDYWRVRYSPSDDPNELQLQKIETGGTTTVAQTAWNPTVGTTYKIRWVMKGSSHEVFIDDVSTLTGTDNFNSSSTKHGFWGYGAGASPNDNNQEMDNLLIKSA